MRVLMVSALFPTTVLTGGTQVPLAQALALRQLGHDVQLFGGYISHMPGQVTRATEVSGFPARLVDVAGRLDPEAPEFFVNPEAQRQFSTMLDGGFDVVHFHSLQGLGSAMVGLARARGARTAVQMHDFFWVCDRQFLVTKDLRPCSGPGGLGCVCPVSQDKPSRMAALAQADALLVPTEEMRLWLSNLGLDDERLQVGGWPSPDLPPPASTSQWETSPPYVLYLGGLSSEKGWPTLLMAASGDDADSVRVICPGIPQRAIPGELHSRLVGGPLATRAEIALLMSHAHGVIVPSIAAETFSYVAREALSLGIPAVITDGPGGVDCWRTSPDSVILLPRGRPDHLRSAMVELLGRKPPDGPVPLSEQTDLGHQLVDIYSAIGRGEDRER